MLKKILYLFLLTFFVLIAVSCGWSMKARNNKNLVNLKKGMTKQEVLAVMGEPLRDEVYNSDNVWYYFTESLWSDGMITHDECTPVFFKDEKLAGWGQRAYKKTRQINW